jgi:uncharacterized protein (TIRG00374 family)
VLLKYVLAAGLIAWMIVHGLLDLSSLSVFAKPVYLLLAMILVFSNILLNNRRWTCLLRAQGFPFSQWQTLPLTFMGLFFNFVMPGGIGGDVVKGYYLLRSHPERRVLAATTLLMDRLLGMYAMVCISALVLALGYAAVQGNHEWGYWMVLVFGLFVVMTAGIVLTFSVSLNRYPRFASWLHGIPGGAFVQRIYDAIHSYRKDPFAFCRALALSVLSQFSVIVFVWFFARATSSPKVPFSTYLFIVPLGLISMALPVTPAGVGVSQAAIYYLYKMYTGIDSHVGPDALTAYQIALLCWGLLGAYFYVTRKKSAQPTACTLAANKQTNTL